MTQHMHLRRSRAVAREEVVDRPAATAVIGRVLILISAAVLLIMGVLAVIDAGLNDDLATPVVSVMGFSHTAWLGLAEIAVGALLLLAGSAAGARGLATVLGVLMLVAGVLVLADTNMPDQLAIEHSYGTFLLIMGGLATLGGLLPGGWTRRWARSDDAVV